MFGPSEYFALAVLGLALCASLSGGSPVRGLAMALAGILLGLIGIDTVTGVERLTFGIPELANGIQMIPMLMGLYGLGEILYSLGEKEGAALVTDKIGRLMPNREEWRESSGAIGRGTVLGFFVGLIPGGGALLSSLLSYTVEKRLSKTPEQFGKGAIAGVAGPESANNSAATSSFVPLFTLGLPGNAVTAVLFAALLVQNIQPGPMMLVRHADVFWGVIASMYVGNVMLLVLNLPLVGLWVQLLRVPFWILGAAVLVLGIFGAYSLQNSIFDVYILVISGAVGYLFRKADLDCGPLVMAFILSEILDTSLRQSLIKGDGSIAFMFGQPITCSLLIISAVVIVTQFYRHGKSARVVQP
jgi:putative tricarboxylic transport membrane protein